MSELSKEIINEVKSFSPFAIAVLEIVMYEDNVANVVTVRTQGVSALGTKSLMCYRDFPLTFEGRKQAAEIAEELGAWKGDL